MTKVQAIGIGCRRCASSLLHDCLNDHPDIRKPERGLHFFSEQYHRGVSWYEREVEMCAPSDALNLEYSVSYMYPEFYEKAAARMYAYNSEAKVFVTIRHPVERAFSDFLRSQRNAEISAQISFDRALQEYPEFLERGRYKQLLAPFLAYYGAERLKVLIYDDLESGLQEFLAPLWSFLDVRPFESEDRMQRPAEAGRGVSIPMFQSALMSLKQNADTFAHTVGLDKQWELSKKVFRGPYKRLRAANTKQVSMSEETRQQLIEFYQHDVDWVREVTGRALFSWTH